MSQQFDGWYDIYARKTVAPVEDPLLIVGAKQFFLMAEDKTPIRDLTGGGGAMPLGHAQDLVGDALFGTVKYFYQGGPHTLHGLQMEYLGWLSKHFPADYRYQFFSSETEALRAVPDALGVEPIAVTWINRDAPRHLDQWRHFTDVLATHQHAEKPEVAVVAPINPDTFEPLSTEALKEVVSLRDAGIKIVWDETVLGMGWRRSTVFDTPHYADAVVLGGGLGGGLPLGAIGGRELCAAPSDRLAGSALAYTAGLHTLRLAMVSTAGADAPHIVDHLVDKLEELTDRYDHDFETGGEGLLRYLRFKSDRIAGEVVRAGRKNGLLMAHHGEYVRLAFSVICELRDVDGLVGLLDGALKGVGRGT